jgi:hypothetical protein
VKEKCIAPLKRKPFGFSGSGGSILRGNGWEISCPECGAHDYFCNPSEEDAELRPYLCEVTTEELLRGLDMRGDV